MLFTMSSPSQTWGRWRWPSARALHPIACCEGWAVLQVEREAQGLKRTAETLEGRTAALSQQLAQQRAQADQRLFAAQQETDKVCTRLSLSRSMLLRPGAAASTRIMCLQRARGCVAAVLRRCKTA